MKKSVLLLLFCFGVALGFGGYGCNQETIVSSSGIEKSTVTVEPTLGTAFAYNNKSGNGPGYILGFVLFVGCIASFVIMSKSERGPTIGMLAIAFVLLSGAVLAVFGKTLSIRWNNAKVVDAKSWLYYEAKNDKGHAFWDSIYNSNLMVSAAKREK